MLRVLRVLRVLLASTAEILTAVQLVTRTQIMLVNRFDTHTRLMAALNEKQALNECDTGHWSWIRDLKDDLAHWRELHKIREKAYNERQASEAKLLAESALRNLPHKTKDKHSTKHPNRDYRGPVGRPKQEKGKGKQPYSIKFMGEYGPETEGC